ncbi:MAG TPA: rod-binding protein [Thermotogota bacterium]|nr:rod-binding protein [Thermotogota bacterium]HPJ89178.1 rod-binding protein [Thermotogota bacterium]HPR95659.1 rod-binding protein [Thermotogota bacterium]
MDFSVKPIDTAAVQKSAVLKKIEKVTENTENEELREACNEFVSVLLSQIFKDMDNSIQRSELTEDSYGGKWYREMMYDEFSKSAAKQSMKTLSDSLYNDIVRSQDR